MAPLVPRPSAGRTYAVTRPVRLGDADPSGRLRLDAVARFLQDVANDDAVEVMGDAAFGWVVRRTTIEVSAFPGLGESIELTTWGSGIGSRWAERRTSLVGARSGRVEAASLWVCIDPASGRPRRLEPSFHAAYDEAIAGRAVGTKLAHPDPDPASVSVGPGPTWVVRRADLDVLGHVNNAVAWAVVEEVFAATGRLAVPFTAEVEYRGSLDPGQEVAVRVAGGSLWIAGDGVVTATAVVEPAG